MKHWSHKLPDQRKIFRFPVFSDYKIVVISSNDYKKDLKRRFPNSNIDEYDHADAVTIHAKGETFIYIPHKVSLNIMVHESYHAVRRMLKYHDVVDDNEVIAYHLGYLVQEISDWRWTFRVKRKKK